MVQVARKVQVPRREPETGPRPGLLARRALLSPRATAAAMVYEQLRAQIISLDIPPGSALSENDLAKSFGVSRTPVREALLRLADEMLVEIVPKSGTTVSRIPYFQLTEAITIRKALEETAVRNACERASRSQLTTIWAFVERQREADRAGDPNGFHEADEGFHAAIADAAGYPGIWQLVKQVKVQVDRYRRLTLPQTGRMSRVIKEHAAIVTALEKRDAERAVAAIRGHLEGLEHSLPNIRDLNPDYFVEDVSAYGMPRPVHQGR